MNWFTENFAVRTVFGKTAMATVAILILGASISSAGIIYQNDFATRTSAGAIGGSTTFNYAVGDLAGDAQNTSAQDEWFRRNTGRLVINIVDLSNYGGLTNAVQIGPGVVSGSPPSYGYALQKIGSSVSSGLLQIRVDMNPPNVWSNASTFQSQYALLGDDEFHSGEGSFYTKTAAYFGFSDDVSGTDTGATRFAVRDGNGDGTATLELGTTTVDTSHWYRFVANLDIAANSYSLHIYDMGTTQPGLATPTPAVAQEIFTNVGFRTNVGSGTGELDGITTLGFSAFHPESGSALFDNVVITDASPVVPEPCTSALLVAGGLGLLTGRRHRGRPGA